MFVCLYVLFYVIISVIDVEIRWAQNSFRHSSFVAVDPQIWNSLPHGLRTLDNWHYM